MINGKRNEKFNESNEKEKLTVNKLKEHRGLENISNQEAEQIIDGLYRLARISFILYNKNDTYEY